MGNGEHPIFFVNLLGLINDPQITYTFIHSWNVVPNSKAQIPNYVVISQFLYLFYNIDEPGSPNLPE